MSASIQGDDGSPGFGVYIHWPFCAAKCPYCDFNSHVRHKAVDQSAFVSGFQREIAHMASLQPDQQVTSIFFGGGTPSLMDVRTVEAILESISQNWTIDGDIEISMEANPSSVEADRFKGYREAGVNRLSLGVQSLDDNQLRFLGRLHTADEARKAIELARATFPRISFDMIYARPDQSLDDWRQELDAAIELAADHLSLYQLTIEQNTPFFDLHGAGKFVIPDPEHAAQLFELTQEITHQAGLPAYEISNHAKKGMECRHNLTYWRSGTWAGIGPGAHGRLQTEHGTLATSTIRNPEKWLEQTLQSGHGMESCDLLSSEEVCDEYLLMGMRLKEGMEMHRLTAMRGAPLDSGRIEDLIQHGMIEWVGNARLRATANGSLVLDAVIADLAA